MRDPQGISLVFKTSPGVAGLRVTGASDSRIKLSKDRKRDRKVRDSKEDIPRCTDQCSGTNSQHMVSYIGHSGDTGECSQVTRTDTLG